MKKLYWSLAIAALIFLAFSVRVFRVTQSPPSPYWEEAALGYDAFSILRTGRDHHGNPWPLIAFESFGDWKPAGYFYALIPFIQTFGLNLFSVRLLSVLAGAGIVVGIGVLIRQLTRKLLKPPARRQLILLTLFVSALSPWLIQFSRAAWEVNLAAFLIIWGVIFGQKAVSVAQKHKKRFLWLTLSLIFLFAAVYTYHSARILAPLLGLTIAWQFFQNDVRARRKNIWLVGYILPLFLTAFLLRPFTAAIGTPALDQRIAETSIFSDLSVIEESNRLKDLSHYSPLSRVVYHRYVLFGGRILAQFFTHFNADFLFIAGDTNPRHSSQYFGLFYPFEAMFMLLGGWWIVRYLSHRHKQILAVWLIFGILPSALAVGAPHALRLLPTAPVFMTAVALGAWQTLNWLRKQLKNIRFPWPAALIVLYLAAFGVFYRHLLTVYPQRYSGEWQYGYQQLVEAVEKLRAENPALPVYITREEGRPAMYYWFYTQTDPALVQQENATADKDQGEFLEFQNIHFIRDFGGLTPYSAIIAGSPLQLETLQNKTNLTEISNLKGQLIWQVARIE